MLTSASRWCVATSHTRPALLEIAYGSNAHFPQIAALHTDSSYLRLTGTSGMTWGTSIILLPVVWEAGHASPTQGVPITITASQEDQENLLLHFTGRIAGLAISGCLCFSPPADNRVQVDVAISLTGKTRLEAAHAQEAFKIVMLSSMHVAPDIWDTDCAFAGAVTRDIPAPGQWLFAPPLPCRTFGLRGGQSQWQHDKRSPTIAITVSEAVPVAGWVSSPGKGRAGGPNSDNVALWAAYNTIRDTWHYTITASL